MKVDGDYAGQGFAQVEGLIPPEVAARLPAVGLDELEEAAFIENDFAGAPYARIVMQPGDAVLYRGVTHAHGRMLPNPNRWSAHMFLHWVDRDGPHAGEAFDRRHGVGEAVDFDL